MSRILRPSRARLLAASSVIAAPFVLSGAYANTLTRLIPDLYAGLDVVSRELVGFIPSAFRNANAERAAVGQSVVYFITPSRGTFDVTPAMNIPEPADETIGNGTISITKSKGVEFGWTGEEQKGLNSGSGYLSVQADNFAQALRTLCNAIEADLAAEASANASRAYGVAGTTPFASNTGETAQVRKILDDNGAPPTGRSLIINTTAGAALRTLAQLTKVNEAGTSMVLTDGQLINLNGFSIKESAQVNSFTAGTAASGTSDTTGYAVGTTSIGTAATGTGALKAGDSITFAGDVNIYQVVTGKAAVGTGTTAIVIAAPGLLKALPASAVVFTVIATHASNIAFAQGALHLVARAPALPQEGDAAIDRMLITDPRSGMTFEVAIYAGYRKIRAEVVCAWGVKAVKPAHIAMLLG